MNKPVTAKEIFWIVFILLILILVPFFWWNYNALVKREENVKKAWAQVENQYQRRADLILNLAETAKGYATHERETFESVIEARSKATQINVDADNLNDVEAIREFNDSQEELTRVFSRLMAVIEAYPDLKASDNFIMLQGQLEGTENRILNERAKFNNAVNRYNSFMRRFPKNVAAWVFGFEKIRYFETVGTADTAPELKF